MYVHTRFLYHRFAKFPVVEINSQGQILSIILILIPIIIIIVWLRILLLSRPCLWWFLLPLIGIALLWFSSIKALVSRAVPSHFSTDLVGLKTRPNICRSERSSASTPLCTWKWIDRENGAKGWAIRYCLSRMLSDPTQNWAIRHTIFELAKKVSCKLVDEVPSLHFLSLGFGVYFDIHVE